MFISSFYNIGDAIFPRHPDSPFRSAGEVRPSEGNFNKQMPRNTKLFKKTKTKTKKHIYFSWPRNVDKQIHTEVHNVITIYFITGLFTSKNNLFDTSFRAF